MKREFIAARGDAGQSASLFAARLHRWRIRKVGRQLVGLEGLDVHLDEADEGTTEVRPLSAAAIDDHTDARDRSTVLTHDVDCLLNASTARDHVLRDDKAFPGRDGEAAAQNQTAGVFFNENVAFTKGATDFLTNDYSPQGGRDNRIALDLAQFVSQTAAHFRSYLGVLEQDGALKELAAVQAGAEDKMAVEKRAGFSKESEKIVAHSQVSMAFPPA